MEGTGPLVDAPTSSGTMRLFRHHQSIPHELQGAVVAIGNFDGVHRGHQAVIGKARRLALEFGAPTGVLTFEPHPRQYFQPELPPFRLTPFRVKTRLIETLGVDAIFALPFNQQLASLSAEAFVQEVLGSGGLGVRHLVVGDNFHFGRKRQGDSALLAQLGRQHGFGVTALQRLMAAGTEPYSSTHVRQQLQVANPTRAALLLGRYWEIEGRVLHGAKRGRELGYPTANIAMDDFLLPSFGVYAVRVRLDRAEGERGGGAWIAGVANIGLSPMFNNEKPLLEVHLFDYDGDLYGKHLRVALVDYLRPELVFDDLEGLKRQMAADSERARGTLAWEEWDNDWPASPFMATGPQPATVKTS